jgi:hypothetical protein
MTRIARFLLIVALPFAAGVASAADQQPLPPSVQETDARSLTLPPSDPGLLTVIRSCDGGGCPARSFYTSATTSYQLGDEVAGLAELRRLFSLYPDTFVLVVLEDDRKHVKTVRMSVPKVMAPAPNAAR